MAGAIASGSAGPEVSGSVRPEPDAGLDDHGELTTSASWDAIWANHPQRDTGWLRQRLKRQRRWEDQLSSLLSHSSPGDTVLELGCAPGDMLLQLNALRSDLSYRGIDYAPVGLELTRRRLAERGIAADLRVADMFEDSGLEPADLVVSFGLIEHFDPVEALRCHYAVTKPGGRVAVTVPNYAHPVAARLLRRFSPETIETHNLEIMSTSAIVQALEAAGFTDARAEASGPAVLPSSRVLPSPAGTAFARAARGWTVFTEVLPDRWPWAATIAGTAVRP